MTDTNIIGWFVFLAGGIAGVLIVVTGILLGISYLPIAISCFVLAAVGYTLIQINAINEKLETQSRILSAQKSIQKAEGGE